MFNDFLVFTQRQFRLMYEPYDTDDHRSVPLTRFESQSDK